MWCHVECVLVVKLCMSACGGRAYLCMLAHCLFGSVGVRALRPLPSVVCGACVLCVVYVR